MNSLKDFENYRVAVFTMDDMVFNLNQIRYDFSQLLYPNIFKNITYHEYALRLGTIQSMYSFLDQSQAQEINEKIESYLYSEKNLRNIKVNENIEAVFNLLKSKNIKIVLFTTHSSKRARQLLKYKGLLPLVDQVVSISDYSDNMPSIKLFHTIIDLYETNHYELLIVSSLNSIFKCVRYSPIDTIYIQISELTCIEPSLKPSAMMTSLFELLQYILFGKYTTTNMYNDFLGYNDTMSDDEKRSRFEYLKMKYSSSPELLPIVEEVFSEKNEVQYGDFDTQEFRFHFSEISKNKDQPILKQEDVFEKVRPDEVSNHQTIENTKEQLNKIDHTQSFKVFENPETKEFELNFDDIENKVSSNTTSIQPMDPQVSDILEEINQDIQLPVDDEVVFVEENIKEKDYKRLGAILLAGLMNFVNAFLIVSCVGIIYMAFADLINQHWIVDAFCDMFIVGYAKLCLVIFDAIPIISSSQSFISSFSPLFNQFIVVVLFTFIILSLYNVYSYYRDLDE